MAELEGPDRNDRARDDHSTDRFSPQSPEPDNGNEHENISGDAAHLQKSEIGLATVRDACWNLRQLLSSEDVSKTLRVLEKDDGDLDLEIVKRVSAAREEFISFVEENKTIKEVFHLLTNEIIGQQYFGESSRYKRVCIDAIRTSFPGDGEHVALLGEAILKADEIIKNDSYVTRAGNGKQAEGEVFQTLSPFIEDREAIKLLLKEVISENAASGKMSKRLAAIAHETPHREVVLEYVVPYLKSVLDGNWKRNSLDAMKALRVDDAGVEDLLIRLASTGKEHHGTDVYIRACALAMLGESQSERSHAFLVSKYNEEVSIREREALALALQTSVPEELSDNLARFCTLRLLKAASTLGSRNSSNAIQAGAKTLGYILTESGRREVYDNQILAALTLEKKNPNVALGALLRLTNGGDEFGGPRGEAGRAYNQAALALDRLGAFPSGETPLQRHFNSLAGTDYTNQEIQDGFNRISDQWSQEEDEELD